MKRRAFIAGVSGAGAALILSRGASAQVRPFVIRIVRDTGWEQLMQRESCIPGTVYTVDPDQILTDLPGTKVCYSMELPLRANNDHISAIPLGSYQAKGRLSDHNGPVIELARVPNRDSIQIHSGNMPDHTLGCILLGTGPVKYAKPQGSSVLTTGKCWIAGSKDAREKLLGLYGWTALDQGPPARAITVIIG